MCDKRATSTGASASAGAGVAYSMKTPQLTTDAPHMYRYAQDAEQQKRMAVEE